MTLLNKTPQARKEALAYCRRCLAVMVCCVLVFGLTVPAAPRAKAAVLEGAAIAGVAGGSDLASSALGLLMLIGLGDSSYSSSPVESNIIGSGAVPEGAVSNWYSPAGYELGSELMSYLQTQDYVWNHAVAPLIEDIKEQGGIVAGKAFDVPALLGNTVREWMANKYPDGVSAERYMTYTADSAMVYTLVDPSTISGTNKNNKMRVTSLGSLYSIPRFAIEGYNLYEDFTYTQIINEFTKIVVSWDFRGTATATESGTYAGTITIDFLFRNVSFHMWGATMSAFPSYDSLRSRLVEFLTGLWNDTTAYSRAGVVYVPSQTRYYVGKWIASEGLFYSDSYKNVAASNGYYPTSLLAELAPAATGSAAEPYTQPIKLAYPISVPVVDIDDWSIPLPAELAPTDVVIDGSQPGDVTEPTTAPYVPDLSSVKDLINTRAEALEVGIAGVDSKIDALPGAIADALPITGAIAGDQVVADTLAEPDSLGAVFISKFPFCIPWDLAKAINLLAAQPVTPHWEIDFFSGVADVFGGFGGGDTTIVIDLGQFDLLAQICRWTETVIFIYALASGTKRYIWPA